TTSFSSSMAMSEISRCTYHVFLSFRGEDTRKSFTDHLYTALVHLGIQTFRDDEEIERGNNIKDEIEKAILHHSKISIVVSQRIMLHPHVFYDVDPSLSETNMIQRWRNALKEVAAIGGMVLQDRHESQFIQDIVKEVQNKLHLISLYVPPYLVGIDSLVTQINQWLEQDLLFHEFIVSLSYIEDNYFIYSQPLMSQLSSSTDTRFLNTMLTRSIKYFKTMLTLLANFD
ncbi:hypothetical protein E1A91_D03G184700v1, partial [Gossypium mustelinum]